MRDIIEELKNGNTQIVDFFVVAEEKWKDLLHDIRDVEIGTLAKRLQLAQGDFERICGSRNLGKTMMPWSGFAHLYSCQVGYEGKGPSAYKLAQAFEASCCSIEVKSEAKTAANLYGVEDFA